MSNSIEDGGPAFPFDWKDFQPTMGEQVVREQFQGMSLRDYFAAKAMQAIISNPGIKEGVKNELIVRLAFEMADCMIKGRKTTAANS